MPLFEPIFDALNRNGVRYVVVGGVAVVLHGVARLTGDLDLAVDLTPSEARKAIDALVACGFRSRLPVDPHTCEIIPERWKNWMAWDPLTLADTRAEGLKNTRMAPLSRMWRTSARVSTPSIATTFQRFR